MGTVDRAHVNTTNTRSIITMATKIAAYLNPHTKTLLAIALSYGTAEATMVQGFQKELGDDLSSDSAKSNMKAALEDVRRIGGVVASLPACREAKSGPMQQASRDYYALNKAYNRAKQALAAPKEPSAKLDFVQTCNKQIDTLMERIRKAKPEKLTFPAEPALAALQNVKTTLRRTTK